MNRNTIILLVVLAIMLAGFIYYNQASKHNLPDSTTPAETTDITDTNSKNTAQIANPASVFCTENGGTSEIVNTPAGQASKCVFPSGESCDEWELFRGECLVDGVVNTTTYTSGNTAVKAVFRLKSGTATINAPELGLNNVDLKLAVSASGARYLSSDEKIEFWEHQGEASLTIDGDEMFKGKVN